MRNKTHTLSHTLITAARLYSVLLWHAHLPSSCRRAAESCSTKNGILSHWHSARQRSTSASKRYWEKESRDDIPPASLWLRSTDTRGVTADCQRETHWACANKHWKALPISVTEEYWSFPLMIQYKLEHYYISLMLHLVEFSLPSCTKLCKTHQRCHTFGSYYFISMLFNI